MSIPHNVRIVGGFFDGCVFQSEQVFEPATKWTAEEIEAGYNVGEWEVGTRCKDLLINMVYEYDGATWILKEGIRQYYERWRRKFQR